MRKVLLAFAAIASLGTLAACADAPTTAPHPGDAPSQLLGLSSPGSLLDSLTSPVLSDALQRSTPLATDISASAVVGDAGGVLVIPSAGLRVEIPRGAVRGAPITITARALAGSLVAYEFQPHGKQFARALRITQDLSGTKWLETNVLALEAVYFKDKAQVDPLTGVVTVDEVLPAALDLLRGRVSFQVQHFSGYAVSTGRAKGLDND